MGRNPDVSEPTHGVLPPGLFLVFRRRAGQAPGGEVAEEEERGGWGVRVGVSVGMGRCGFGWGRVESVE